MMESPALVLMFCWLCFTRAAKDDFGLLENESLLRELCVEDRDIHQKLITLNSLYKSVQLDFYLKYVFGNLSDSSVDEYVKHPINSYNLIQKASTYMKELSLSLEKEEIEDSRNILKILNEKLNKTNTFKTVTNKDMLGAV